MGGKSARECSGVLLNISHLSESATKNMSFIFYGWRLILSFALIIVSSVEDFGCFKFKTGLSYEFVQYIAAVGIVFL